MQASLGSSGEVLANPRHFQSLPPSKNLWLRQYKPNIQIDCYRKTACSYQPRGGIPRLERFDTWSQDPYYCCPMVTVPVTGTSKRPGHQDLQSVCTQMHLEE